MKKKLKKPSKKNAGLKDPTHDVKSKATASEEWKRETSTKGTEPELEKRSDKPGEPDLH